MALQHQSKSQAYREFIWEVRFEKYLEHVKGTPYRLVEVLSNQPKLNTLQNYLTDCFEVLFRYSWAL